MISKERKNGEVGEDKNGRGEPATTNNSLFSPNCRKLVKSLHHDKSLLVGQ